MESATNSAASTRVPTIGWAYWGSQKKRKNKETHVFFMVFLGSTWFYLVFLGFSWFYLVLLGFSWFYLVLLGFSWFYLVFLVFSWFFLVFVGSTWFYLVLLGFSCFCLVLLGFTWFFLVLLGFSWFYILGFLGFTWFLLVLYTWFYLVLLGFSWFFLAWFFLVLLGFSWFYLVLLGFSWFYILGFTEDFTKQNYSSSWQMVFPGCLNAKDFLSYIEKNVSIEDSGYSWLQGLAVNKVYLESPGDLRLALTAKQKFRIKGLTTVGISTSLDSFSQCNQRINQRSLAIGKIHKLSKYL